MRRIVFAALGLFCAAASCFAQMPGVMLGPGLQAQARGSSTTWNPADKQSSVTLSGGNLVASGSDGNDDSVRATTAKSSGKWYFEIKPTSGSGFFTGVATSAFAFGTTSYVGQDSYGYSKYGSSGAYYHSGSTGASGTAFGAGSVVMIAVDFTNLKIWFGLNGTWDNSGNPATNTGGSALAAGVYYPAVTLVPGTVTGQFSSPTYAAPSGFSYW